jgi:cysteine desulfurase / selenocysteine lyase
MDELKTLVGNADVFPILKNWDFYNHAGVSPQPSAAGQAFVDYVRQITTQSYLNAGWHAKLTETRELAAQLLRCDKQEIAFIKNTSEGLSLVAKSIDWKPGDRIVTTKVEYPTNMYPWIEVAQRYGAEVVAIGEETDDGRKVVPLETILYAAADKRTKLVALSHVEFGSGQRHDLAAIGRACRERGVLFVVDAIQSLGAVPVDAGTMQIDYLAAGGQKWLLSPEGTGIFYCRRELAEKTRPLTVGALNVVNWLDFDHYDFTLRPDAGRFESGGFNIAGLMAMRESLKILVGLGSEAVSARIKELGDRLIAGVEAKGYAVASPREGEQWSGIISIASNKHSHDQIAADLRQKHRIELVVRHGRLRVAPHFYNTEAQIDRLIDLLPAH